MRSQPPVTTEPRSDRVPFISASSASTALACWVRSAPAAVVVGASDGEPLAVSVPPWLCDGGPEVPAPCGGLAGAAGPEDDAEGDRGEHHDPGGDQQVGTPALPGRGRLPDRRFLPRLRRQREGRLAGRRGLRRKGRRRPRLRGQRERRLTGRRRGRPRLRGQRDERLPGARRIGLRRDLPARRVLRVLRPRHRRWLRREAARPTAERVPGRRVGLPGLVVHGRLAQQRVAAGAPGQRRGRVATASRAPHKNPLREVQRSQDTATSPDRCGPRRVETRS